MEIHNSATFIELSWSSPDQTHHLVSLLQPASGTPHIFSQTLQCCILLQINLWDYCSPCSASLTVCKKKTSSLLRAPPKQSDPLHGLHSIITDEQVTSLKLALTQGVNILNMPTVAAIEQQIKLWFAHYQIRGNVE